MTEFKIGKDKLVMYGAPVVMAVDSNLIESILAIDPPYTLASNMTVFGGALTVLWLYLHGFEDAINKVELLSFKGYLNFFDLISYFGIDISDQILGSRY